MNLQMKRVDFENGTITSNILGASLPMLVAQILSLLYNIVDRIYIARIPHIGTAALGAVGLCFPVIVIITAFSNLFGSGGAPLFSIERGKNEPQEAKKIMNISFSMVCICAIVLMVIGFLFARPILVLFGASKDALIYAYPYLMLYLIGTLPSMIATGMNPFINAQGYSTIGMLSVTIGAVTNLLLDPLFIFVFGLGVCGAAIATVISQTLSAAFVFFFLTKKAELKVRLLKRGTCQLYSLCKKHCKPGNCRIYHAVNKQSGNDCLQQCTFRHRRRYLHFCYDHRIQCQTACRNSDLCNQRRDFANPELQLWCKTPMPCKKSRCHDGTYDSRIHSCDVEYHHHRAENPDRNFQFGCYIDERCSSCPEAVFCSVYLHGYAIHWPDGL